MTPVRVVSGARALARNHWRAERLLRDTARTERGAVHRFFQPLHHQSRYALGWFLQANLVCREYPFRIEIGVLPAQKLAQTRRGALGAVLCYACVPVSEFGTGWPDGVPVQIHGMDADPIFVGEGDIYMEAGIPHRTMHQNLKT